MTQPPSFTDPVKFKIAAESLRTFSLSKNGTYSESIGLSREESESSMPEWARSLFVKPASAPSASDIQQRNSHLNAHATYSFEKAAIVIQMRNFCLKAKDDGLLALTIKTNMPAIGGLLIEFEKTSKKSFKLELPFNSPKNIQPSPSFLDPLNFPGMTIARASMVGKLNPTKKNLPASLSAYTCSANNDWWTQQIFGNQEIQDFCNSIPELNSLYIGHPDYLVGGSIPIIRLAAAGLFENANSYSNCAKLVETVLNLQLDAAR